MEIDGELWLLCSEIWLVNIGNVSLFVLLVCFILQMLIGGVFVVFGVCVFVVGEEFEQFGGLVCLFWLNEGLCVYLCFSQCEVDIIFEN